MSELSRDQILSSVHPLDDAIVAEIIATGATPPEFKQACAVYVRNRASRVHDAVPNDAVGHVVRHQDGGGADG